MSLWGGGLGEETQGFKSDKCSQCMPSAKTTDGRHAATCMTYCYSRHGGSIVRDA